MTTTLPTRGLVTALILSAAPAMAQDARALFHEAYYLEHEEGRLDEALELYRKVAEGRGGDAALRARAAEHAAGLAEEFVALDMARLVPGDAIFFAQMDRPGEQLSLLLDQLGLLGEAHAYAEQRIAVSPLLVDHLLGLSGAAVAVTELDPEGEPRGVVLLHPGDHEGVRGLIDTALPAMGERIEPIHGFPSWSVEGDAVVSLTRRLLVAGNDRDQVAAVVSRLDTAAPDGGSLADDPRFVRAMGERGPGLISFYLNAEPLRPMIRAAVQQHAQADPGAAMAMNVLDMDSFDSVSGRLGVDPEGLGLDLALELAEGHRNLVFNLMRRPTVSGQTLELVPEGAAFFLATALNPEAEVAPIARDGLDQPVVSALDFGRELFGNVVDLALFGMPAEDGAGPLPDVSLVLRVNDTERSRALWGLCLGMAAGATGGGAPAVEELGGASVTRYTLQDVPLYLAAKGDRMVLSPNRGSIERALGGGYARSISKDEVLGASLTALDRSPTFLLAACPGRLARMVRPFMSPQEYAEVEPVAQLLGETSVTLLSQHSDTRFALAARVENVPDVSVLVNQAVEQQRQVMRRSRDELEQVAHTSWSAYGQDQARAAAASADDMESLRERFDLLVEQGKREQAIGLAHRMVASVEDAKGLNNLAWALLTEERYEGRYDAAARILSVRSNELTDHDNWAYVDTLALAEHRAGNHRRAVELQERVLELVGGGAAKQPELRESLERYRAAAEAPEAAPAPESVVVR